MSGIEAEGELGWRRALLLLAVMLVASYVVYGPVMHGEFASDDIVTIVENPYVQELSAENLRVILDPKGPGILWGMNYAPVHLVVHAVQRHYFGADTWGYHLVNLFFHALNGLLVVLLLRSSRLPLAVAVAAGFWFLFHPAQLESVAMPFQIKTLLSTSCALGSILLFGRRPVLACLLFALALLTKISGAFALPVVALSCWMRRGEAEAGSPRWIWALAFLGIFVLVAIPELSTFQRVGELGRSPVGGPAEQVRWMVALAMRYFAIAASGFGVSIFHEPTPPGSWLDPFWLGGLAALALLSWRWIVVLRRGDEEALYWLIAVAAYAPVSQLFPFLFPMADRYLYAPLIGLLGGALLAARAAVAWLSERRGAGAAGGAELPVWLAPALLVVALGFGVKTHLRAPAFESNEALFEEASRNYPKGIPALMLYAKRNARNGDVQALGRSLEKLEAAGYDGYITLMEDPAILHLASHPQVRGPLRKMIQVRLARLQESQDPFQIELLLIAHAHQTLGNVDEAVAALERAREMGGRHQKEVEESLRSGDAPAARRSSGGP